MFDLNFNQVYLVGHTNCDCAANFMVVNRRHWRSEDDEQKSDRYLTLNNFEHRNSILKTNHDKTNRRKLLDCPAENLCRFCSARKVAHDKIVFVQIGWFGEVAADS